MSQGYKNHIQEVGMTENTNKFIPALWGGVFIGVISAVPGLNLINCACCAGVIGGGIFSVYLYRRQAGEALEITMADGALLGLIAGLIGAVINGLLGMLLMTTNLHIFEMIEPYIDDPDILEMFENISDQAVASGLFFVSMISSLVINCVFALLGGLLGVSFWGKPNPKAELDKSM